MSRSLPIAALLLTATPALAEMPPALTCELEAMCIVFSDGFYQCSNIKPDDMSIAADGTVTLWRKLFQTTVTHEPDDYYTWSLLTEPDSFGLIYNVQISTYTNRVDVIHDGTVKGQYTARCWEPEG